MADSIHVLHVDDEPDFVDTSAAFLQREIEDIEIHVATEAKQGLDILAERSIDCIISDHDMAGQDGIDFLKTVRKDYPNLPFILFTGKGSEEVASEAIRAGVTDYLQKNPGTDQYELLANRVTDAVEHQQSKTNYRQIFEKTPDGIVIHGSEDGSFVDMNQKFFEMFGYESREEFLEAGFEAIHRGESPYTLDEASKHVQRALEESAHTFEWLAVRKDGSEFWAEVHLSPVELDGQERVLAAVRDITDRKQRIDKLAELRELSRQLMYTDSSEETARLAVDGAQEIIGAPLSGCHLLSQDGEYLEPVATAASVEDLLGGSPRFSAAGEEGSRAALVWGVFENREPISIADTWESDALRESTPARSVLIQPLGEHGTFIVSASEPNKFDQGDEFLVEILAAHLTTALDRIERERTLSERSQRLEQQIERLDEFASVVSHDLRNPLAVAQGRLELARDEVDHSDLDSVANALNRMDALIEDLLTLAREDDEDATEFEPVDLEALVEECWNTVATNSATLRVETRLTILGDESRLRQLLENLIRNAVEHGGESVTVTIGDFDDGFFIEDDGPGIPEDERVDVFEAGYSTTEGGTGFGLSIVKRIVGAHGWDVRVTAGQKGGARFEISGVQTIAD